MRHWQTAPAALVLAGSLLCLLLRPSPAVAQETSEDEPLTEVEAAPSETAPEETASPTKADDHEAPTEAPADPLPAEPPVEPPASDERTEAKPRSGTAITPDKESLDQAADPPHSPALLDPPEQPQDESRLWQRLANRITLTPGAEFILLDVEGKGGFSNRSPDPIAPRNPGTSAFLDRATLDVHADLVSWITTRLRFRAGPKAALVDRAYFNITPIEGTLRFQLGLNRNYEREQRRTESYGLLQSSFWRSRQMHLTADYSPKLGPFRFHVLPSVATQRPLGDKDASKDPGLPIIGFDHYAVSESNPVQYGGLAFVEAYGLIIGGFGYSGKLQDNADTLYLQRIFDGYEDRGDSTDRTNHWYGLRAGYEAHGVWAHVDWVARAQQGLLRRNALEAAASYTFSWEAFGTEMELEPFVRYSSIDIENFAPDYRIPQTWDRFEVAWALMFRPWPFLMLHVEYLLNGEDPGVSREGKTSVPNNEFLTMIEFEVSTDDKRNKTPSSRSRSRHMDDRMRR